MVFRRTQLLVSVRNAAEALEALEGGADIIDVKEPSRGPLGMAKLDTIRAVADAVAGRVPVSVAMGELRENPPMGQLPKGIAFAKIGLSGAKRGWQKKLAAKFAEAPHVKRIAVGYFNASMCAYPPVVDEVVAWALEQRAYGVLLDTYMKDFGSLFERRRVLRFAEFENALGHWQINEYVREVQKKGLVIALAGSLRDETFEFALSMNPDVIGVRGAACVGNNRKGAIDQSRVRALAGLIAAHNAQTPASAG